MYNPNKYIRKNPGCTHLLADAKYLGLKKVETSTGVRKFYEIALLFYRQRYNKDSKDSKDVGELVARPRIVTISTKNETTEFNIFHKATYGVPIVSKAGEYVVFDEIGKDLEYDIKENTYNYRLQWNNIGKVSVIESMSKLNTIYLKKNNSMVWPNYITNKYPKLLDDPFDYWDTDSINIVRDMIVKDKKSGYFSINEALSFVFPKSVVKAKKLKNLLDIDGFISNDDIKLLKDYVKYEDLSNTDDFKADMYEFYRKEGTND